MKLIIATVLIGFIGIASCSGADVGRLMEKYMWQKRVLLIFSPALENKEFQQQDALLEQNKTELKERDVTVWYIIHNDRVVVDGHIKPQLGTPPFYKHYAISPDDFTIILLGKDGDEKLRKKNMLKAEKLFSTIDSMPMRRREIENRR